MSSYFVHTMDVDKLINEGLEVEAKCLKFQQVISIHINFKKLCLKTFHAK